MLIEPKFPYEAQPQGESRSPDDNHPPLEVFREAMPVVLVMVWSTPRQLQTIVWAIAELDDTDKIVLHGQECIWEPEVATSSAASEAESFDEGEPIEPVVELRRKEGIDSNAR